MRTDQVHMADSGKLLSQLADRISYLIDVKGNSE